MRDDVTADGERWWQGVTRYQWMVLGAAWLGWVFDSMDTTIYAVVLQPALHDLLSSHGIEPTQQAIGWHGGIILSIFVLGWAIGGIGFGLLADRLGRTRTLVFTILVYATFTGLVAFAENWWQLAAFRFVTALGIGGEWAAGAALVAEVWPEKKRAFAACVLQSAWAVGFFCAALINLVLAGYGWRVMFLVGIVPALAAILVRYGVKEPERWTRARSEHEVDTWRNIAELFSPAFRRDTLVGSMLSFAAVFGTWGATTWVPTIARELPDLASVSAAEMSAKVSYATMSLNVGGFFGYLAFGPLSERFGRRPTFAMMFLGSVIVLPTTFLTSHSFPYLVALLPFAGFFSFGLFSGFPIYLPELYPTRIRVTGVAFCFNSGRFLAFVAPLLTGTLVGAFGGFRQAAAAMALIYALGLVVLPFARETRGQPLAD